MDQQHIQYVNIMYVCYISMSCKPVVDLWIENCVDLIKIVQNEA